MLIIGRKGGRSEFVLRRRILLLLSCIFDSASRLLCEFTISFYDKFLCLFLYMKLSPGCTGHRKYIVSFLTLVFFSSRLLFMRNFEETGLKL